MVYSENSDPNLQQVGKATNQKFTTTIKTCDDKDEVDEQSSADDTENEGDSDADEANNKIVAPDTNEGLRGQFNQLFVESTRDEKHEHGH